MVQQKIKGKVIMVSSILGLLSFVGFSQYSPSKYALKGIWFLDDKLNFQNSFIFIDLIS